MPTMNISADLRLTVMPLIDSPDAKSSRTLPVTESRPVNTLFDAYPLSIVVSNDISSTNQMRSHLHSIATVLGMANVRRKR